MPQSAKKKKFDFVGDVVFPVALALSAPRMSMRMFGPFLWKKANAKLYEALNIAQNMNDEASLARLKELAQEIDLKKSNPLGNTALMLAAKGHQSAKKIELILPFSDPLAKNKRGETALMLSTHLLGEESARLILPVSDAKALNNQGESALIMAARNGSPKVIRLLLPHSDLLAKGRDGESLPAIVAENCQYDSLGLVLAAGPCGAADADNQGNTALMVAASRRYADMIQMLLPVSDANAKNNDGETALMLLASGPEEKREDCAALLARATDCQAVNNQGKTAFDIAVENGAWSIADALSFSASKEQLIEAVEAHEKSFKKRDSEPMPRCRACLEALAIQEALAAPRAPSSASTDPTQKKEKAAARSKRL